MSDKKMKIKKMKETLYDIQEELSAAHSSDFLDKDNYERYTDVLDAVSEKLDELKAENKKLKKQVDKLSQKLEDREDQKEQEYDENEYDEEDEFDRD